MSDTTERSQEEDTSSDFLMESEEKKLAKCFKDVQAFLTDKEYLQYFGERLENRYPNIGEELTSKLKDLQQTDCGIVIAGETSAGKTTLINRILGRKLLFTDPMESTTKIYRIQYSETYQIKIYRNKHEYERVVFGNSEELKNKLRDLEDDTNRDTSISQVDVMLPFAQLRGNVTIVDTPGIGDSEKMTQVLKEYIPKAVAFVFVVDVSRAGGLQDDRILKILRHVQSNMDAMHCLDSRDVLFLINKWDCIETTEERKYQIKLKLREKIEDAWERPQRENVFDTSLKQSEENESIFLSEYGRFETGLHYLIQKKKNIRIQRHTLYLAKLLMTAKCYVEWEKGKQNRTKEENLRISTDAKEMIHKISTQIREMERNKDAKIRRILQTLTKEVIRYIHSTDFKDLILHSEPCLTSFYRVRINTEIGKRITKATESWMVENIPDILKSEISCVFLADAKKINSDIQTMKSKIKELSGDVLERALIWTFAIGLNWLFNRFFWGIAFGPQVGLIFGFIGAFGGIMSGIADVLELLEEPQEIITRSFTRRIKLLDEKEISKAMEGAFKKYLENVSTTISQNLWMEIKDISSQIEFLRVYHKELEDTNEHLEYLLKKIEVLEEQITGINCF